MFVSVCSGAVVTGASLGLVHFFWRLWRNQVNSGRLIIFKLMQFVAFTVLSTCVINSFRVNAWAFILGIGLCYLFYVLYWLRYEGMAWKRP